MIQTCITLVVIFLAEMVYAQETQPQNQIFLPRAAGGTPASFLIEARAKYVAAYGAYQESAAIAEKIHAEAVSLEIKNSVDYVKAWFERKDINREWRKKNEWKSYIESLDLQQKAMEKRINEYFQNTLKGNVTSELNYLLQKLYFVQYMTQGDLKPLDTPLTKEELEQIYLTDGNLVFIASDPQALKTPWPYALRGEEFAEERKEFEESRDAMVQEIRGNGRAGTKSGQRIMKAVNQLLVTLETVYPPEKRIDFKVYMEYSPAKNYLNSLIVQADRARKTNDRAIFDGSLRFEGKTTLDLIQYMCQKGLAFAKPPSGDDRVYKPLFMNMRHLYLTLGSEIKEGGDSPAKR